MPTSYVWDPARRHEHINEQIGPCWCGIYHTQEQAWDLTDAARGAPARPIPKTPTSLIIHPLFGGHAPTITRAYIQQHRHVVGAFVDGYLCASGAMGDCREPTYPVIRDWLAYDLDCDYLVACQIALWETREDHMYWLAFYPAI